MSSLRTSPAAAAAYAAMNGIDPVEAAGLVQLRVARSTGVLVGVYDAVAAGLEDFGWATVCEPHSGLVIHDTRALAVWHAPAPEGWCEGCQALDAGDPLPEHVEDRRALAAPA